tara:strand:- start:41704 stop:43239 length:1536 start_codon:yes stop_codon:yes gene_type:complete
MATTNKLYNLEIEKQFLAGMLKHKDVFETIDGVLKLEHFYSEKSALHKTIFHVASSRLEAQQSVDEVLVSEKINQLGLKFDGDIEVGEYMRQLKLRKVTVNAALDAAKEIIICYIRRKIIESAKNLETSMRKDNFEDYDQILSRADSIYNEGMSFIDSSKELQNIYEDIEEAIENVGNGDEFCGPEGPFPLVYKMYGSLAKPGNITMFAARAGSGKTTLALEYATQVSAEVGCPVIHFDNGEMSKLELQKRQTAALSGVSYHLIDTGKWRNCSKDVIDKVRGVFKRVKGMEFYYYNVGGMQVDEMGSLLKRGYYSKVGRGNYCVFSFDYLKTSSEKIAANRAEHQIVGQMMDKFKKIISVDILHDDKPQIGMISSVQSNRLGIVSNKGTIEVSDDESQISLSDRIIQICSHMFILRKQKISEKSLGHDKFGTHFLINVKARHMGEDIGGAFNPVDVDGTKVPNYILLDFENFSIKEVGDMRVLSEYLKSQYDAEESVGTVSEKDMKTVTSM